MTLMGKKKAAPEWKKFRCPPLSAARKEQIKKEAHLACDELLKFSAGDLFACPEEDSMYLMDDFHLHEDDRPEDSGYGSPYHHSNSNLHSSTHQPYQRQDPRRKLTLSQSGGSGHFSMVSQSHSAYAYGLQWEYADQIESIRVEKVKVRSENKKAIHYFRGMTQIEASVEEIMDLFQVDADQPNIQLEKKLAPDLLHSALLYEIQPYDFHQSETLFIGIRWSAVRSPYVLVRNRDYCYLECQRRFTLPDGRRGFVRCLHSVKIKCCPDMEKSHGFVRASMYRSGLVCVESRRDRRTLDVVQAVYTDLKGSVPQFVASMGVRNTILHLEHLKNYVNMKRVANQSFVRRSQLVQRTKAKTCFVCVDDIGTFRRRYNCQKCGEVICTKCKLTINAEIPVVGKMKLTICSLCSLAINRSVLPQDAVASTSNRGYGGSASLSKALGERPCSATPLNTNSRDDAAVRKRALSMNSFHTACLDQTTIYNSLLATEV